jgi:hypothetical protein
MKIQWTAHLKDPEAKDRFEKQIIAAKPVLDRLQFLLEERRKAVDSIETGVEKYIQPGWSAVQAHYNGEKASIKYILNLLNLDQRENKDGRQPI